MRTVPCTTCGGGSSTRRATGAIASRSGKQTQTIATQSITIDSLSLIVARYIGPTGKVPSSIPSLSYGVKKARVVSKFAAKDIYEYPDNFLIEIPTEIEKFDEWVMNNILVDGEDVVLPDAISFTKEQLVQIPRIGPATADKILDAGHNNIPDLLNTYMKNVPDAIEFLNSLSEGSGE